MGIETYSRDPLSIPDLDGIEDCINPRLLCSADQVKHVIADVNSTAVINSYIEKIPSALMIPGVVFVDLFSCINVISNKRLASSKSK